MWSLSDEALLAGLGSQEPESSAAFVRRFQGRVYGLTFTILGEPQAAEEAAQETFVRAWKHAEAYDARRGAVSTWLLTIARNVAIDMVRVRRPEAMDPELILATDRPQDEGGSLEEAMRVRDALRELPDEQRRAIVLAVFYGRTAREIGEMDGIPVGTVKTRIRSAMFKLRDKLKVNDD